MTLDLDAYGRQTSYQLCDLEHRTPPVCLHLLTYLVRFTSLPVLEEELQELNEINNVIGLIKCLVHS